MIIAGLWRNDYWWHVATDCTALVKQKNDRRLWGSSLTRVKYGEGDFCVHIPLGSIFRSHPYPMELTTALEVVTLSSLALLRYSISSSNGDFKVGKNLLIYKLKLIELDCLFCDGDRLDVWCCRNVKFECQRPCCVGQQTYKSSTMITTTTTTAAAAVAAAVANDDDHDADADAAGSSSCIKHHRRIVGSQPVGPVRSRSTPGLCCCDPYWPLTWTLTLPCFRLHSVTWLFNGLWQVF